MGATSVSSPSSSISFLSPKSSFCYALGKLVMSRSFAGGGIQGAGSLINVLQLIPEKKGCSFKSLMPFLEPNLF